jgi:hypothetical protein
MTTAATESLGAVLLAGEAGTSKSQCMSCLCVWLMYFGVPPEADEQTRWERDFAAVDDPARDRIRITRYPTYAKLHKNTGVITLERALKRQDLYEDWFRETLESFDRHGLHKCSAMLQRLVASARLASRGKTANMLAYLRRYFLCEHEGLGLPRPDCERCAISVLGASTEENAVSHVRPTVPTGFDCALSTGFGCSSGMQLPGFEMPMPGSQPILMKRRDEARKKQADEESA